MIKKIKSFIKTIFAIVLILLFCILGIIIYDEIAEDNTIEDVNEFVSNITMSIGEISDKVENSKVLDSSIEETLQENNYINEQTEKFFYNQLDECSKIIYNAMETNKENMKTGNYEINLGTKFSELLSKDNGEELLGYYYQSAIEAYIYDNPDVFYIEFSKLYLNIETTTKRNKETYRVFINSGNELNYLTDDFSSKEIIDSGLNEIEKIKDYIIENKKSDKYENIKFVHDYLVDNIEYEQTISKANIYDIYGALIKRECVCEGYAKAFKYLMDSMNIPCIIISGEATNSDGNKENHAWNYVQINNLWYGIDCTWDDPIIIGPGYLSNSSKYRYFLKGENSFNESRIPNGQFTEGGKVFAFPSLSTSDY